MAIAGNFLKRFDLLTLRFLEGYHAPEWLREKLIKRLDNRIQRDERRFNILAQKKETEGLNAYESKEYARLDWLLMYIPDQGERLPTTLGNLLRAYELRPYQKYGLDAFICFPRLWLVLPDHVKRELAGARDNLDAAARLWNWGLLFMIWSIWAWWAIPVSLLTLSLAYKWMLTSAKIYGQLVEAAFDLYRHLLYKELRFRLPANPAQEVEQGKELTEYLWRGSDEQKPAFTDSESKGD